MTDYDENLNESPTNVIPEENRPFSSTELTNKQIEFARKYLNETEETRSKYLRRIKRFLDRELDVFSEMDDVILLAFLRAKMFDFKETCLLMKSCAEALEVNQSYFNRIDEAILRRVIESKTVNVLPYRDFKGRLIFLTTAGNWETEHLKAEDMIFGTVIALNTFLENPLNQVVGYIAIIDCKGVCISHFTELSSWLMFGAHHLQNSVPASLKEIHVIHSSIIVQWIWNIVSPLLAEKLRRRIHFYDSSDWEKLHEKIPPCILPEELGGHLGPLSFEHWANDVPNIRKKFYDKFQRCLDE